MNTVKVAVIGGGITGRLVQFVVPSAVIYDWKPFPTGKPTLTRQWGTNYLWRPLDGIPCKEFRVVTRINGLTPTLDLVRAYKQKIHKQDDLDNWELQFQPEQTGFEFLELPPSHIQYDHRIVSIDRLSHTIHFAKQGTVQYDVLISSIPLYSLLSLLGMPEPSGRLRFKPIFYRVMRRPPDAPFPSSVMYVNYLTDPTIAPYRFCDREGERHYESIVPFDGPSSKRIIPGKIYAHPSVPDVLDQLEEFDIFTFGRFGSWAPDELVHETYDRIREWAAVYDDIQEVE